MGFIDRKQSSELQDIIYMVGYYYYCKKDTNKALELINKNSTLKEYAYDHIMNVLKKKFKVSGFWPQYIEDRPLYQRDNIYYELKVKVDKVIFFILSDLGGYSNKEIEDMEKCKDWVTTKAIAIGLTY